MRAAAVQGVATARLGAPHAGAVLALANYFYFFLLDARFGCQPAVLPFFALGLENCRVVKRRGLTPKGDQHHHHDQERKAYHRQLVAF